jgi:hypothetical protein
VAQGARRDDKTCKLSNPSTIPSTSLTSLKWFFQEARETRGKEKVDEGGRGGRITFKTSSGREYLVYRNDAREI